MTQPTITTITCPACEHNEHQWCTHDATYERCECATRGHLPMLCACGHSREAHARGLGYGKCIGTGCRCPRLRAPARVAWWLYDATGSVVTSGTCLETELESKRAERGFQGPGMTLFVSWEPKGPAFESRGTLEGWIGRMRG